MSRRHRLAIVVARCGEGVFGGAERLALRLAEELQATCEVEILTSCARDYTTWANAFEAGRGTIGSVPVRRFAVDRPRDPARFDALSRGLADQPARAADATLHDWLEEQGPRTTGLAEYLLEHGPAYDAIYFVSYLYATTYAAIGAARGNAILMPLAHDEWMLRLPHNRRTFSAARLFAFVSEEERALVQRRFPDLAFPGATIGAGIDVSVAVDPEGFRARFGLGAERLAVVVGRVDPAKGTDALVADFAALRALDPTPRTLVLVGPVTGRAPEGPGVRAIGPVDEQTKFDALAAADVAVIPSAYESFSIAALEALAVGTPIVVNGASDVLIGHCRRSNAGLWYASRDEFVELMRSDLCGARLELGRRGMAYVRNTFTWPRVAAAHLELIERLRQAESMENGAA